MKKPVVLLLLIVSIFLASCVASSANDIDHDSSPEVNKSVTLLPATATPSRTLIPSNTTSPTATNTQLPPTVTATPYDLTYFTDLDLYPGVIPVNYIEDTCSYLENRWGEGKSSPGTIVVPIMFHSVAKPGREITDTTTISMAYFEFFMTFAREQGFSTVTVDELIGFLDSNQKIPELSMILILDDRRPGVTELFMPYLEENDWTLTLAWPTTDATGDALWDQMEGLASSGRLDVQSHGHDHIYIQDYTALEEIEEEIYQPIEVIQEHFNTTPQAIIWPGGNFTQTSVEMASEAGFEVGFTVFSRGPLIFNWVPRGYNYRLRQTPLLLLPRYWSTAADVALIEAIKINEAAKKDAAAVKTDEINYYETYCQPLENN